MNPDALLQRSLQACPLVAILRGIQPGEAEAIGGVLVDAGFRIIEVPLNSPEPFQSIERLARAYGERALIGAGTVLAPADVARVADAGGRLVVSPNVEDTVISAAVAAGLVTAPGYFTPTEAFRAVRCGASALKLFPAEAASPAVVKAHRAVLPPHLPLLVVGGVTPDGMAAYFEAGADGFGIGGALYRPGFDVAEVRERARAFMAAVPERPVR